MGIINEANDVQAVSNVGSTQNSEADKTVEDYDKFLSGAKQATPYASALTTYYDGNYPFKTAAELASATNDTTVASTHYGDWPMIETMVVNKQTDKGRAIKASAIFWFQTGA